MVERSFDLELLLEATDLPYIHTTREDFKRWFENPKNLMFAEGRNVGLATYEYPGMYSLHWYYEVRGREAIELGKKMVRNLFDNYGAETLRGFIRMDLKASRWAVRQVGFNSYGILTFPDGEDNELFMVTKDEFYKKEENNG